VRGVQVSVFTGVDIYNSTEERECVGGASWEGGTDEVT
jgi:hypothetical protein